MKKKYSLFIGRWQIPEKLHDGHLAIIEKVLNEGKNVLIAIRDVQVDEKNPYSASAISGRVQKSLEKWGDRVKIIIIPDIEEVCYGRGVGWGIREIKVDPELEKISATEIRKNS